MATKAEIIAQVIATYVSNDIGAVTAPILRNTLLEILNCEDLGPGIGDATAEINAILESIFGVSDGDLDNSYVVGVPSTLTQLIKSTVLSAFGRTVTASADAAALRAILELGTAAQNDTANFELAGSIASALVAYYNKTQVDALLAAIPTFNDTYELVTSVDLTGTLPNSRVLVNSDSIQVVFDAAGKVSFNFIGTGTEPVTVSDQYLDDVKSLSNINRNIASPGSGTFAAYTPVIGDPLLLYNQTNPVENGVYIFNGPGVAMTRRDDFDETSELITGTLIPIVAGNQSGSLYMLTTVGPIVVDVDPLSIKAVQQRGGIFRNVPLATSQFPYTVITGDTNKRFIVENGGTPVTINILQASLRANAEIDIFLAGTGPVTIATPDGVVLNSVFGNVISQQYGYVKCKKRNTTLWDLVWQALPFTADIYGLVPPPGGVPTGTKFLNDIGNWETPSSSSVPWGSITGTLADQTDLQAVLDALSTSDGIVNSSGVAGVTVSDALDTLAAATGAAWGDITGSLSSQTDLQAALDAKQSADANLDALAAAGNWKVFYTDGSGALHEVALGTTGKVLTANGATSAPTFETPAPGGVWGDITGTLSDQTDLVAALNARLLDSANLSDLTSASAARGNLGLGTLATQSGTFSGTSSGTNTGDQDLSGLQPLDGDLTAIAAISGTSGLLKKTAANTWSLDTSAYLTALPDGVYGDITVSGSGTVFTLTKTLNNITAPTGDLSLNSHKITNLATPTASGDAVTKAYADALTSGLYQKGSCKLASTAALTVTYANGTAGVGATLTNAGAFAILLIDLVAPSVGDRILVKNQAAPAQNGIYTVTNVGTVLTNWVMTRATDFDEAAEVTEGAYAVVEEGTANTGTLWIETGLGPFTIGTTAISFTELQVAAQTITLTGDVTGSGTASFSATIANNAVTLAKMATMATASLLGRNTAGTGTVEVLSAATVRSLLALVIGTNVQAWDTDLDTISGLTATTDSFMQAKGSAWATRTIAQVATDLNPVIAPVFANNTSKPTTLAGYGITDAQPLDADLTTIAGLTATTDNFMVSVASAWASRTPAQVKTTLGLVIGTDVQAWDADLDAIAAISGTSGFLKKTAANTWALDTSFSAVATTTEILAGTDNTKIITPLGLQAILKKGADTASAATTTFGDGDFFHITGTTGITAFAFATDFPGRKAFVVFDSVLTVTYNATSMITLSAGNINTTVGDCALIVSEGSGNFRFLMYNRSPPSATVDEMWTATNGNHFVSSVTLGSMWKQGSDIVSTAAIDFSNNGEFFHITGTSTITSLIFNPDHSGRKAFVEFTGALTLTHNATSLILPTGANILTAAGDTALFVSEGSGNFRCLFYQRKDGTPLVNPTNMLKSDTSANLTVGYTSTGFNKGTLSSGTYTPAPADGNLQYATNNGAHTLAAPTASGDYTIIIAYTNGASAGTLTITGMTKQTGDALTTTNTSKFMLYITKINSIIHLNVVAMQ